MAKYKLLKDYTAKGSNWIAKGTKPAQFILTKDFKKDEIIEGVEVGGDIGIMAHSIYVKTTGGKKIDATEYTGDSQFNIPFEYVTPYIEVITPKPAATAVNVFPMVKTLFVIVVGSFAIYGLYSLAKKM